MKTFWIVAATLMVCLTARADDAPAEPTTKPTKTWTGMGEILALVPADVVPAKPTEWTALKADVVNKALADTVGDQANFQMKVVDVGDAKDRRPGQADEEKIPGKYYIRTAESAGPWTVVVVAFFEESEAPSLARLAKGQSVRVRGKIISIKLSDYGPAGWRLLLELTDSQLNPPHQSEPERRRRN